MASPTMINLCALAGGTGNLIGTVDRRDLPPYPVVHYIEHNGARLDGRHFAPMPLAVDSEEIFDLRTRRMHDTEVSSRFRRWGN